MTKRKYTRLKNDPKIKPRKVTRISNKPPPEVSEEIFKQCLAEMNARDSTTLGAQRSSTTEADQQSDDRDGIFDSFFICYYCNCIRIVLKGIVIV